MKSVDQHPAIEKITAEPEFFRGQGAVVAGWRRRGRKRYGPYYRLSFRENGRQRSIYLGREGPLVERVREALAQLQRPMWQARIYARSRRKISAALRLNKAQTNELLGPFGLRLQGFEVRGWRTSPYRWLFRRAGRLKLPGKAGRFRLPGLKGLAGGFPKLPRLPSLGASP